MPSDVISKLNVDGTVRTIKDRTNFVGTEAEWNALTDEEKDQYDTYDITDDWSKGASSPTVPPGDYLDLMNKPQVEGIALIGNKTASDLGLAKETDIPTNLSDLNDDSTHRLVTDLEKSIWDNKDQSIHFSSTEKVVGSWFGNDLYQKTFVGTISTNDMNVEHNISDIDMVVEIIGGRISSSNTFIPFGFSNGDTRLAAFANRTQYAIRSIGGAGGQYLLTIRYTKIGE